MDTDRENIALKEHAPFFLCPAPGCQVHAQTGAMIDHLSHDHRWPKKEIFAWLRKMRKQA